MYRVLLFPASQTHAHCMAYRCKPCHESSNDTSSHNCDAHEYRQTRQMTTLQNSFLLVYSSVRNITFSASTLCVWCWDWNGVKANRVVTTDQQGEPEKWLSSSAVRRVSFSFRIESNSYSQSQKSPVVSTFFCKLQ